MNNFPQRAERDLFGQLRGIHGVPGVCTTPDSEDEFSVAIVTSDSRLFVDGRSAEYILRGVSQAGFGGAVTRWGKLPAARSQKQLPPNFQSFSLPPTSGTAHTASPSRLKAPESQPAVEKHICLDSSLHLFFC